MAIYSQNAVPIQMTANEAIEDFVHPPIAQNRLTHAMQEALSDLTAL